MPSDFLNEIRLRALRQKRVAIGMLRSANRDLGLPADDETSTELSTPAAIDPLDEATIELERAQRAVDRALDTVTKIIDYAKQRTAEV